MKITDNTCEKKFQFSTLCSGDVLKYNNSYYMKIDEIRINTFTCRNAINLECGGQAYFQHDWMVQKLEAELIIKK